MKHHYIEAEWINALIRSFANLGLDTSHIIKGIEGFKNERIIAGSRLAVNSARTMWHRADKLAQDPLLGFKVGSSQYYRAIGVLAPVIWHSPNVRTALNNILLFQSLISESGSFRINETQNDPLYCEYIPLTSSVPANNHQILAVAIGTIGIIKAISNNVIKVKHLYLPPSLNTRLLAKYLDHTVSNRDDNLAISFYTEGFDSSLLGCDNNLYQINLAYAKELLRNKNAGLVLIDSVKNAIENAGFRQANIEHLELSLDIHKRTLQRKLFEHGTSFRQLKEEVLKEHSVNLLQKDKIDIGSVAEILGYSEPSAFHRAFKAWFGITPGKFCRTRKNY